MEEHLLTLPVGWQLKRATVRAGVVVGLADIGGIVFEGGAPGVVDVLVDLVAIALDLEETRHGEIGPLRVVELQREEACGGILMVLDEIEFPQSFHREVTA